MPGYLWSHFVMIRNEELVTLEWLFRQSTKTGIVYIISYIVKYILLLFYG